MRNRFIFVLGLALAICSLANAQTTSRTSTKTYRWVDDDGVMHFSDSPRPGSTNPADQAYEIRSPNVSQSRALRPRMKPEDPNSAPQIDDAPATFGYQNFSILSPNNGDTLWNIGGTLNVNVQLSPPLREGDGIVILLDGQALTPRPVSSSSIKVTGVYRGEHTMTAVVRDATGSDVFTSAPIRFVVQQSTVN